ncbi:MAG TPA: CRTAC1 family protein, partial [Opitutus sp.]|nr:CRTAC1 family protein [Opitutus sp.]
TGEAAQIVLTENGAFLPPLTSSRTVGAADAGLLIFEVDGDGRNDLLLLKGGVSLAADDAGYQPRLFFNRGGRRFQQAPEGSMPSFTSSAGPAVAADFNGDGWLDVFLGGRVVPGAYGQTPRSALWINRGGTFTEETARFAPALATVGMVSGALATDVDHDGRMDLLIATQWGEVQCWRNVNGSSFENVSERLGFAQAGAGWWNSLAAADFNGDGRIDYVVGNVGLNTPYRATRENPVLLFRGDFDTNGRTDLIEATSEGDVLAPRRGRSTIVAAMQSVGRRFPTFAAFAATDLTEIIGAEALRSADRLEATELRSGVFLSQPGGTFRFDPLPRLAQIAPIFGLVAGDFDGDGHADICAAQNSYAPIPEMGRFDGGLGQFLRGDGKGGLSPVPLRESQLMISGDGKGLAVADLNDDGWPDLIATRNNANVRVFRNHGRAGGNALSVTLRGSTQNPGAIGARVELFVKDGSTQVAEVTAGSGYLSQSSAMCFFGYRSDNVPREVNVTWPSGATTTHPVPEGSRKILLKAPDM